MRKQFVWIFVALMAAACSAPVAPTPPPVAAAPPALMPAPSGPSAAVLVVERFSLYRVSATTLAPSVQVRESSGKSAARVDALAFNLADGEPWANPRVWPQGWNVDPGATAFISDFGIYGDPDGWFLPIPAGYTGRISVEVRYFDNEGRKGTVSALAALPQ